MNASKQIRCIYVSTREKERKREFFLYRKYLALMPLFNGLLQYIEHVPVVLKMLFGV